MTAELYLTISYIAAGLCGLFLVLAAVLFFKLNIIGVIGDLSGSTVRKAVKEMKEHNASGTTKKSSSSGNGSGNKVSGFEVDKKSSIKKASPEVKAVIQKKQDLTKTPEVTPATETDNSRKKDSSARFDLLNDKPSDTRREADDSGSSETTLLDLDEGIYTVNDQDSDDSQTALLDADYTDEASETTILDSDIETEDNEGETSLLSGYSYADNSDDGETTFLNSTDTQDEEGSETTVLSVFNGVELENLSDYDEDYAETTLLSVRQSGEWAETIRIIDEITFVSLNELID